jgi:hypothetical protein
MRGIWARQLINYYFWPLRRVTIDKRHLDEERGEAIN